MGGTENKKEKEERNAKKLLCFELRTPTRICLQSNFF